MGIYVNAKLQMKMIKQKLFYNKYQIIKKVTCISVLRSRERENVPGEQTNQTIVFILHFNDLSNEHLTG